MCKIVLNGLYLIVFENLVCQKVAREAPSRHRGERGPPMQAYEMRIMI